MNAEQLSKVGSDLVRRCGTRDPFQIANALGINVIDDCENLGSLKGTGRRRGKLFTKSNEEAWRNRSDTTKAATPSAANRQGDEKISRPAICKAADPLLLRCICITVPFSARNPRQLLLGHRPRWYRAAVASASSQAPADDRSGAARFP